MPPIESTLSNTNIPNTIMTPSSLSELIEDSVNTDLTPIQKFYSGTSIFVTGATGFLGKILLEKLLRSCPDLSTIYMLIRNKKGKNMQSRIEEIFNDCIFERLKNEQPKFRHKVVGVAGDCSLPELGISSQDRKMLIDEVSIVFHVAATVRFDEKLKLAVAINVRSPQDIIALSKEMPKLKSFVHVSTAYSNSPNSVIEEKIYPSPIDSKKLLMMTDVMPDKMLDHITPAILDKWPNTYTYTKQLAEDVVRLDGTGLPIAIFRPAIVVSTYREPMKAWINNLYGPTGVCAGAGTGVLRTIHCDANINANVIPVDMCVNSLIATAWEVGTDFEKAKKEKKQNWDIPVYHFESSNDKPITWGKFMFLSETFGISHPSAKAIWYYCLTLQSTRIGYFFASLFLHFLPAIIVDGALLCVGRSPKLIKIYKKIHKFTGVISYFCTRNWQFQSSRVQNMISKMTEKDQEIFFCDLKKLSWDEFFLTYLKGIRIHLLQDPIETLPEAKVKWARLYWLHQCTKALAVFLLFRLLWALFSTIYSFMF